MHAYATLGLLAAQELVDNSDQLDAKRVQASAVSSLKFKHARMMLTVSMTRGLNYLNTLCRLVS